MDTALLQLLWSARRKLFLFVFFFFLHEGFEHFNLLLSQNPLVTEPVGPAGTVLAHWMGWILLNVTLEDPSHSSDDKMVSGP